MIGIWWVFSFVFICLWYFIGKPTIFIMICRVRSNLSCLRCTYIVPHLPGEGLWILSELLPPPSFLPSTSPSGLQPRAPDLSGHLKRVDTLKRNGIYNLYKDAGYANNQLAMHNVKVIRKTWDRVWYSIFGRAQAGGELLQNAPSTRKGRLWSHYGFLLSNMNYFPFATLPVMIILP